MEEQKYYRREPNPIEPEMSLYEGLVSLTLSTFITLGTILNVGAFGIASYNLIDGMSKERIERAVESNPNISVRVISKPGINLAYLLFSKD